MRRILPFLLLLAGCGPRENIPLIGAARTGDVAEMQRLLKTGADPNLRGGVNNWTALMHAVHKNQLETARALLHAGAEVDSTGAHGDTALMMAAGYGETEMVKLLLKAGADPAHREVHGTTALDRAAMGVVDIDAITVGKCQAGPVKALLEASPSLSVNEKAWSNLGRAVKRLTGCDEVVRLVEERRAALAAAH